MNRLRQLIHEIHRRSLWQVLLIYVGASWAVLQVVDTVAGALQLPDWLEPVALVLLIVGLPVVLATAFVQEGISRGDATAEPNVPSVSATGFFTWRNAFGGGVLAFALWGVVAAGWVLFGGGTRAAADGAESAPVEQSVAVLPFVNMSGDPDNEYFSDGITEELLNALAQIPHLRVPARTSSFAFKGQNIPVGRIADTLNVVHILEGSVRRDGERVAITAQLVNARTDTHLWSETFERDLDDIFAVQREIGQAVAEHLEITLSGAEEQALVAEGTENAEAHDVLLRGQYLYSRRTPESISAAIAQFERAVSLDSEYAEAYAWLSESFSIENTFAPVRVDAEINQNLETFLGDAQANWERARAAAQRAVSLAPDLGMAQVLWALTSDWTGELDATLQAMERAVELSPGQANVQYRYSQVLYYTGRVTEGVARAERALELDPVSPIVSTNLGWAYLAAGRVDDAITQLRETVEFAPQFATAWSALAYALLETGRYDEGREAAENAAPLTTGGNVAAARAIYEAAIHFHETGEPRMRTLPDIEVPALFLIGLYDDVGQLDRAADVFNRLARMPGMVTDAAWFAAINQNPRYEALLREAEITW